MSTVTAGNVVSTGTITAANIAASGTLSAGTLSVTSLGVNTASPAAALDVNGAAVFRSFGSEGGEINFYNPDNSTTGLVLDVGATDNPRLFSIRNNMDMQIGQLGGTGGVVRLYTGATERFTVASTGTVTVASNTLNLGTSSISANGYSRLPNGLLLQWGTSASINQDSSGTVTFPVAFTTLYNIQITGRQAINTGSGGSDTISAQSTTQFTIAHGADGTSTFYWMAIGV